MERPAVVVFTGLPGTGKSTIADLAAQSVGAPAFSGDWLLGALAPARPVLAGLDRVTFLQVYRSLLLSLITRQCMLRQSALVDCLVTDEVLTHWQSVATEHNCAFRVIECVCSDEDLHHRRVEERTRAIPGWHEIDWNHVLRMREDTSPLTTPRTVLDSVHPVRANLIVALNYIRDGE